ncbi:Gx transporter family protein [Clostridia bacterium]|nr:Gx transporter family protein [Clostridia bacterium]
MNSKKMMRMSMLLAVSLILAYLETLLPSLIPIPGMKLGLANIVVLYVILTDGKKEALMISIMRLLCLALFTGRFLTPGFYIGFSGALMSWVFMALGSSSPLSIIGLSIFGAVGHNVGQLFAAVFLVGSTGVYFFLPILLVTGLIFGSVTGFIVTLLIEKRNKQQIPLS